MSALLGPDEVGRHVVQFYDSDADLIARAGEYLSDASSVAVVIATDTHRDAFAARLPDDATVVWLDAAGTLAKFMREGRPDRDAFFDVIGGVVRAAAATGRPVRAYGEMVALLWEAGDVAAAIELEALWNELGADIPFSLYCAYRSESVAGHEHADALHEVCALHSAVVPSEMTWRFAPDATAPAEARRVVVDALRRAGYRGELLHDARIVIAELVANAVVHAATPFSVSIRRAGPVVRIGVRDRSRAVPVVQDHPELAASGRGLHILGTLAERWGVDPARDGKLVWAELAA